MSNCCGEDYHMADCPIVTAFHDSIVEDFGYDLDDYGRDYNPEPELIDPANCDHGDTNGTMINGECIMVCIHCESHVSKAVNCKNGFCDAGLVWHPEAKGLFGTGVWKACGFCNGFGTTYEPLS